MSPEEDVLTKEIEAYKRFADGFPLMNIGKYIRQVSKSLITI